MGRRGVVPPPLLLNWRLNTMAMMTATTAVKTMMTMRGGGG